MHHALAASCYHFVDAACVQARCCVQRHASLARMCGGYLWPASLPKEPMVRRGLEGLTQAGSGCFCTSVLTSGSISEGEGVSLAPAMALSLSSVLSPAERGQYVSSSWRRRTGATQRATTPEKRILLPPNTTPPPASHCCTEAEGERLPPCRITGSGDTLRGASVCLLVGERASPSPDGDARSRCVRVRRHEVTSTPRAPHTVT